jgi:Plasmid pRiA4b ORF-3-like protein
MKRRPKSRVPEENPLAPAADAATILQVKVWLTGISPMVWRRVLVPSRFTLRELHGVIQVAMGWDGIHLYDFHLRAAHYGSWEVASSSPDVTLAALRFRKGARFIYEYDLNIPWRHEVRIEERLELDTRKTYPFCTGGGGACPPEDCGGPESFMARRDGALLRRSLAQLRCHKSAPVRRPAARGIASAWHGRASFGCSASTSGRSSQPGNGADGLPSASMVMVCIGSGLAGESSSSKAAL